MDTFKIISYNYQKYTIEYIEHMKKELKIPKRITPDPILEAVVELRFQTNFPSDAIFGLMYSKLNELFPKSYEALPILQLPEAVRLQDKNLEFAPYHKFKNEQFHVQIGPKVLSINCTKPYSGWDEYFILINTIVEHIEDLKIITNMTRVGVRYIDFFEKINIFEHLEFELKNFPFLSNQATYSTNFEYENFRTNLHVSNSDKMLINGVLCAGSIVDSDTYIEESIPFNKSEVLRIITDAHDAEKKIFYTLIKDTFIETLKPEYT